LDEKLWRSTGEVATLTGTTLQTVRRWVQTGKLPSYRFETARRIKREKVEAFMAGAMERSRVSLTQVK
jgi:excisionase family DNA binding protein